MSCKSAMLTGLSADGRMVAECVGQQCEERGKQYLLPVFELQPIPSQHQPA